MAMPRPAIEESTVSTTSGAESEPSSNMAWPHHHGSAMYDEPTLAAASTAESKGAARDGARGKTAADGRHPNETKPK
jgi:hypothetical protein